MGQINLNSANPAPPSGLTNVGVQAVANPSVLAITAVTDNGGNCEIAFSGSHNCVTNNAAFINSQTFPAIQGGWLLTKIDSTHLVLQGSTYVSGYPGGATFLAARDFSFYMPEMVGDGVGSPPTSGGVSGAVPAPAAGNAAAGKFLKADGTWEVPPGGGGGAVSSVFGRTGAVVATSGDYTVSQVTGAAPIASPALTGTPTAPTAAPATNTTQVATTAFVEAAVAAGGAVTSVFTRTGAVVATSGDYTVSQVTGAAPLASPALTGTPTAPTAAPATNTTQVATTAFVEAAVATVANPMTTLGDVIVGGPSGTQERLGVGTDGQALVSRSSATYGVDWEAQPYDVTFCYPGPPPNAATIQLIKFRLAVSFGANFSGSTGYCANNPTATATYTLYKNGGSIGTIAISTGGTFTFSGSAVSFAIGDVLSVLTPGTNATLANVTMTFAGTRT